MSESEETSQIPVDAPSSEERVDAPAPAPAPQPERESPDPAPFDAGAAVANEHPEYLIAGAFAGAFVFAKLLQRIGR